MENNLIELSMKILVIVGEASNDLEKAYDEIKNKNIKEAEEYLQNARISITKAHKLQTSVIQDLANGKKYELNLLFIHAQDTLMTVMSEITTTERMMFLFEKYCQGGF